MAIILPAGMAANAPIEKLISLTTRAGEQLSMPFTLQDELGRTSAAAYLDELHEAIRHKLNEPVISRPVEELGLDTETLKQKILYIAAFHDSMFGTFNRQSALPEKERAEFIELFLLAVASVLPGSRIRIDLTSGLISIGGN